MAADENQVREKAALDASHQDPANWRGPFYYNPRDHRLLPPKRIPAFGFTVNFANPRSVALLIGMMLATTVFLWAFEYLVNRGR